MASRVLISPSLLSCDFARIADGVARAEAAGADWIHVDVMDGHFVPNLTLGPPIVAAIDRVAEKPLDVHLMIEEPARYAEAFARAGAHVLTFHAEVARDVRGAREIASVFRDHGIEKVGMAVNPDGKLESFEDVLDELDLVLVMSVFPGFGGQSFIPGVLDEVRWLRSQGYEGYVQMDGGISAETIGSCAAAGCDTFVSGSALFGASDMQAAVQEFRRLAHAAQSAGPRATEESHVR